MAVKIVPLMSDDAINSDATTHGALWYAIRNVQIATLYQLLMRPGLNMNPVSDPRGAICLHSLDNCQKVLSVFDEVAQVFSIVPRLIQTSYHGNEPCSYLGKESSIYNDNLPLPLCQIIADYYRMPYPLSFYRSSNVKPKPFLPEPDKTISPLPHHMTIDAIREFGLQANPLPHHMTIDAIVSEPSAAAVAFASLTAATQNPHPVLGCLCSLCWTH